METESRHVETVRGTQSFVHTFSACWKRPSLTALEVLWRWAFGVPAAALIAYEALRLVRETQVDVGALTRITLLDPAAAAATLSETAGILMPPVVHVAKWLIPVFLGAWIVVSSIGRTAVLRRIDRRLKSRPATLMMLQALRMAALLAAFAVWFLCLKAAAGIAVNGPIAAGHAPNVVFYFALVVIATLGMFTLWAVASWALSAAPLLAMQRDLGAGESLAAAFKLGPVRSKLVEINLVMGIVKIALIVLAIVFSATPLPFQSIATAGFMTWWYVGVTVFYLIASDLFHVVRLVFYLEMWRAYDDSALTELEA